MTIITTILAIWGATLSTYQLIVEIFRRRLAQAPELVVEYFRSESPSLHGTPPSTNAFPQPWELEPQNRDKPILVKNVSPGKNAYNVSILPLVTAEGKAEFEPKIQTCITPSQPAAFWASTEGAHPFCRNQILPLLQKSYKDSSMDEFFQEKPFILKIQYGNGPLHINYEAECEILYTKHNEEIKTGKHSIKRISKREVPKGK